MPEDGREIQDVGCMWSMMAREGVSTCGATREVHEVMRHDARERGTTPACGWTHARKISPKIEARWARQSERLHKPAFMYFLPPRPVKAQQQQSYEMRQSPICQRSAQVFCWRVTKRLHSGLGQPATGLCRSGSRWSTRTQDGSIRRAGGDGMARTVRQPARQSSSLPAHSSVTRPTVPARPGAHPPVRRFEMPDHDGRAGACVYTHAVCVHVVNRASCEWLVSRGINTN